MAEPMVQVPVSLIERLLGNRTTDDLAELRALFPQPTQECGVCGRQYPADDPRDTCPVCWPGFGEYADTGVVTEQHIADVVLALFPQPFDSVSSSSPEGTPAVQHEETPLTSGAEPPRSAAPPSIAEQPTTNAEPGADR